MRLPGLDEWITGVHDPNAPFNQDDSDYDSWFDKLEVEVALGILEKAGEDYGEWCVIQGIGMDDVDNMEKFKD